MNSVRKEVKAVSKSMGKMDMVVEKLRTFQESGGSKANCNPHNRNELHGVSVCLSVCPSVYRHQKFGFIKRVAKG